MCVEKDDGVYADVLKRMTEVEPARGTVVVFGCLHADIICTLRK